MLVLCLDGPLAGTGYVVENGAVQFCYAKSSEWSFERFDYYIREIGFQASGGAVKLHVASLIYGEPEIHALCDVLLSDLAKSAIRFISG